MYDYRANKLVLFINTCLNTESRVILFTFTLHAAAQHTTQMYEHLSAP